jgi:hypothetical protein
MNYFLYADIFKCQHLLRLLELTVVPTLNQRAINHCFWKCCVDRCFLTRLSKALATSCNMRRLHAGVYGRFERLCVYLSRLFKLRFSSQIDVIIVSTFLRAIVSFSVK